MTPEDRKDLFEERAAIREYDGGYTRDEAERLASDDVAQIEAEGLRVAEVRRLREFACPM